MRTRAEQNAAIKADQQLWRDLAAEVTPARYDEPGPMGDWSFGDMAGHLVGWRNWTLARLDAFARGEAQPAPPWQTAADANDDDDSVNDWIHANHAGKPAAQLVDEYTASYDQLIATLATLPDAVLNDRNAIPFLEGAALIDVDFTGHLHDEHLPSVRAWLAETAKR